MKAEQQRDREKGSYVETQWIYKGRIIQLKEERYANKVFEVVHHPGAVVIVPIDTQNRILLIRQWRRAVGQIILELPAGTLEKGETPHRCALRELQEETGFAAKKWTALGGFFSAPGYSDEYLHLFIAEQLTPSPLPADEDEGIDLLPTPLAEVKQLIEQNQIRDAKTVAGLLRYLCATNG